MRHAFLIPMLLISGCDQRGFVDDWPDTWRPRPETGDWDDTGDTTDTSTNGDTHTLTMKSTGAWTLAPEGGPYTSLTGTLHVEEYVDNDTIGPLDCDLDFTLEGTLASSTCADCSFAMRVTHTLTLGDPAGCRNPDLPGDTDQWTLGYHPGSSALKLDWADSGSWISWYEATRTDEELTFSSENSLLFRD